MCKHKWISDLNLYNKSWRKFRYYIYTNELLNHVVQNINDSVSGIWNNVYLKFISTFYLNILYYQNKVIALLYILYTKKHYLWTKVMNKEMHLIFHDK